MIKSRGVQDKSIISGLTTPLATSAHTREYNRILIVKN